MSALHAVHALEQSQINAEPKTCPSSQSPKYNPTPSRLPSNINRLAIVAVSSKFRRTTPAVPSASSRGSQPRTGALALKLPQTSSLSHLQFPTARRQPPTNRLDTGARLSSGALRSRGFHCAVFSRSLIYNCVVPGFHDAVSCYFNEGCCATTGLQEQSTKQSVADITTEIIRNGSLGTSSTSTLQPSQLRGLMLNLDQLNDKSLLKEQTYVNGEWIGAKSGKTFEVTGKPRRAPPCIEPQLMAAPDPSTGKVIGTQPEMDRADTEAAIAAAAAALPSFRKTTGRERSRMLHKWYQLMVDNADDLAKLITWENGKPLADAKGEVTYASNFFEWFAEEAPRASGQTIQASVPGNRVFTIKEPVGVCGLITP
jgi:hypothetical protein